MAEVSSGELQTLISTLQNGNTQSGHIIKAITGLGTPLSTMGAQLSAVASAASRSNGQLQGTVSASAPLPDEPDGYIAVDIPGVGLRRLAYYPV